MAKNSQPADTTAAAQNRMPHRIIRALCIATCRVCSCVGKVSGTRYSAMRAAAIATTHHAPRPTGTSAMRLAQMGSGCLLRTAHRALQAQQVGQAGQFAVADAGGVHQDEGALGREELVAQAVEAVALEPARDLPALIARQGGAQLRQAGALPLEPSPVLQLLGQKVGAIVGGGGLTKVGSGALVLTANNSYNGTTTVGGGTLEIGSNTAMQMPATSPFVLQNGATLAFYLNGGNGAGHCD